MKTLLKILLPIVVLGLGVAGAWKMIALRPVIETQPPEISVPMVRVLRVQSQDFQFKVRTQGTVGPRTEIVLVPEVSGRVVYVSPSLASGGFFDEGSILLRIDPRDYQTAVVQARARVAQTEFVLSREKAEAAAALKEWESLGKGEPSLLLRREPQLAEARAALAGAQAEVQRAARDLEKTEIKAPFAGRVRQENIDIGQFVTRGNSVAALYSVDLAEVRLPLPDSQLAYLDLPFRYRGEAEQLRGPKVILRSTFGGKEHFWSGRVVRTEGEIDPRTRMVHVVAQVANPYARGKDPDRPPLAVGMFVEAEIMGRRAKGVIILPRAALRGESRVLVVDSEDHLHYRSVEVLLTDRKQVILKSGLQAGERVCLTSLDTVVDGMQVETLEETVVETGNLTPGEAQ